MDIITRKAQIELEKWLGKRKVIILTGARQVGKTTLFKGMFAKKKDVLWLNADEITIREKLQIMTIENLKGVIGKNKYVIIDEVQRIQNAGLLLKILVDNFKNVQFLATGSSSLDISENIFEPLTGRHLLFHLRPLMMAEMYQHLTPFEIEQKIPFHLVYGNYPDVHNNPFDAEVLLKNLSGQYLYKDILSWKDIRKPQLLEKLLQLLAYQIGSQVSISELAGQLKVKSETVENYLDLLEKSFIIFRLSSFSKNPRKEISKMNKIYFHDNGIRNAVIEEFDALPTRSDQGKLWENFVISERMKWLAWNKPSAKCYFWRNYNQSEVDYVEISRKQISAFEFKWRLSKKHGFSRAFANDYPESLRQIITPSNVTGFLGIDS